MRPSSFLPLALGVTLAAGCSTAFRSAPAPSPADAAFATSGLPVEPAIVRTAELEVKVKELNPARAKALAYVRAAGGRVEREGGGAKRTALRFRVPEARLDDALDSLALLGHVEHRRADASDRTAEIADLEARLGNLTASRDRLRALSQRAESVGDVLVVDRELSRVQGELDALAARIAVLKEAAAMSVIDLDLAQRQVLGPVGALINGAGWVVAKLFVIG